MCINKKVVQVNELNILINKKDLTLAPIIQFVLLVPKKEKKITS